MLASYPLKSAHLENSPQNVGHDLFTKDGNIETCTEDLRKLVKAGELLRNRCAWGSFENSAFFKMWNWSLPQSRPTLSIFLEFYKFSII